MSNIYRLKKDSKKLYKNLKPIFSPILNHKVYFTSDGYMHLLYENHRKPRSVKEQYLKLMLLKHVSKVLERSKVLDKSKQTEAIINGKKKVITWCAIVHGIQGV